MSKLFSVMLGGRAKGCNVELHDVVFAVGESLEATYPQLIKKWFGRPHRLHIDVSVELKYVDGFEVVVSRQKQPTTQDKKLFFVNFGAYKSGFFGEIHEVNFYVASTKEEVVVRAKQHLCLSLLDQHCDDNLAVADLIDADAPEAIVEDIITLDTVDQYYIQLLPTSQSCVLNIEPGYRKLTLPETAVPAIEL
jgi:hypothetical protein